MSVGEFLLFIVFVIALFAGVGALALWMDAQSCEAKATAMQRPHTWGVWTGCMIQAKDGQWVPIDNYRVIE